MLKTMPKVVDLPDSGVAWAGMWGGVTLPPLFIKLSNFYQAVGFLVSVVGYSANVVGFRDATASIYWDMVYFGLIWQDEKIHFSTFFSFVYGMSQGKQNLVAEAKKVMITYEFATVHLQNKSPSNNSEIDQTL